MLLFLITSRRARLAPAALALLAPTALALLAPTATLAGTADVFYGRGVQAYQDGRFERAEAYFDRAVSYGPGEPRSYYFRGLARHELGRPEAAEADMRNGAVIEASKNRVYRLGGALSSTTGEGRELLDDIRTEMLSDLPAYADGEGLPGGSRRAAAALRSSFRPTIQTITSIEQPEQLAALYEEMRPTILKRPKRVIAKPTPPPVVEEEWLVPADARGSMPASQVMGVVGDLVGAFMGPARSVANQVRDAAPGGAPRGRGGPFPGGGGDPFGDDPFAGGGGGQPAGDPFGDDPEPFGAAPAGGDPFGGGPEGGSEPESDPFAGESPADAGADPFGGGDAMGEDPFGGGGDAAGDDPFGGDPFGGGGDPFN